RHELTLCHPRGGNSELRRATAAVGDRLDHQVDIDTGAKPDRHGLRGAGDVQADHNIVDHLYGGRGPERTQKNGYLGERLHYWRQALARFRIAAEIDDPLAGLDHPGRSTDLTIDENGALLGQRGDVIFLDRHGVRTELNDNLAWLCRLRDPVRAVHDLLKRLVGR